MASPLEQVKEIWTKMPMAGRISTIAAAFATIAIIGALVYYGTQTDYGVLFSDLKAEDAQSIVEKLKAANVPYNLSNNGSTILVPHEKITELRLQMAGAGIISGGHVGFDLFDKTTFGATDFAQQVNYRRAIEGELAKTLEGMEEVEGARVHITPKKESVFTEKEEGAKASVMLRVKQGKELSAERTEAITSLISSSVEGLDPSAVSIMDTRGRLLSAAGKGKNGAFSDAGAFNAQLEAKQKYEAETAARVIALLEPVVGENRVKADIAADVDFSQVEQTEERYNPQSQVIRSQQTTAESRTATTQTQAGIVGARANDPTAQTPPAQPNPQTGNNQRNATTTNFEIDKTTRRTIGGGGRVNRMTVSVVVDYKTAEGVDVVRTTEEIQQLQNLVAAAVGTDTNRGDSVVVQSMAFSKPPEEAVTNLGWLDKNKALVSSLVRYGSLVLVAVLLLFFVIRPAHKAIKAAIAPPPVIEEQKLLASAEETEQTAAEIGENELLEEKRLDELNGESMETSQQLDDENLTAMESMMTVAELEAKLNADEAGLLNETEHPELVRIDRIKQDVISQTINETDFVVGTLRSWLREG